MILVLGAVLAFGAVGVGLAVFSGVVGRRPEVAAMVLLVAVGAAGMLFALLGVVGLGATDQGQMSTVVGKRAADVVYDSRRLAAGLACAVAFLVFAGWLVRTGDWQRADDPD